MNAAQRAQKRWKREKRADRADRPRLVRGVEHTFYMPTKESCEAIALAFPGREVKRYHRPQRDEYEGTLQWRAVVTATDREAVNPEMLFDQFQDLAEKHGGEYGGCS
jgi:hypothetical protein